MLYLDKERPYDHFNKANGACYDRLFEGVEDEDDDW